MILPGEAARVSTEIRRLVSLCLHRSASGNRAASTAKTCCLALERSMHLSRPYNFREDQAFGILATVFVLWDLLSDDRITKKHTREPDTGEKSPFDSETYYQVYTTLKFKQLHIQQVLVYAYQYLKE